MGVEDSARTPSAPSQAASRPRFNRVGREQRMQHVMAAMNEFLSLDFDAVDASEQMGLTMRMLAMLNSLVLEETFWTDCGEKRKEARFELLGLQQFDVDGLIRV